VNTDELKAGGVAALRCWEGCREELRDLDAALGDGDLGITISSGAHAVADVWESGEFDTPTALFLAGAKAFASANPSTMAALVSSAMLGAAKAWKGLAELDIAAWRTGLDAGIQAIAARGGAERGDKTILDAMYPAAEALAQADGAEAIAAMVTAARGGVDATTGSISKRGRAAWVGDRSAGHPDGGATAFLRLLECIQHNAQQHEMEEGE
jgi:dihydroxyacetone kinase-like protein